MLSPLPSTDLLLMEGKLRHRELLLEAHKICLARSLSAKTPLLCTWLMSLGEWLVRMGKSLQERYDRRKLLPNPSHRELPISIPR